MLYVQPDELSIEEKEILLLKAANAAINSFVNYNLFEITGEVPHNQIRFKTDIHQKYFSILFLDFLKLETFHRREPGLMDGLLEVGKNPKFNPNSSNLEKSVSSFQNWLDSYVSFENDGEIRKLWFPSVNLNFSPKITRKEFIDICGNISKHNSMALDVKAKTIRNIFQRSNKQISITEAHTIMDEFYEQFHDDLFAYHSSTIAEHLNGIRWRIYEYLQPLYNQCHETYYDEKFDTYLNRYTYPDFINNSYVRTVFWNLMNDVKSSPYMPEFRVTSFLKIRY